MLARRDTELSWQIEFSMPQSFEPTGDHKVLAKCFCWLQRKVHQKTLVECFLSTSGDMYLFDNQISWDTSKLIRIGFITDISMMKWWSFSPVYQLPHWYLGKAIPCVWEPGSGADGLTQEIHQNTPKQPVTLPPGCCSLVRLKSKGSKRPPHNLGFWLIGEVQHSYLSWVHGKMEDLTIPLHMWTFPLSTYCKKKRVTLEKESW